ncbi:MAG: hypothetical protein ACYSWZ_08355 [Planctomycetota bacterium]|jgi:hypothetical protein
MKNQNVHISQKKRIRSFSVDRSDLRRLLEILQERAHAAAELEEKHLIRLDGQTGEEYEQTKRNIKEGFELFITISGVDGRKLTGSIKEIFDSPNYPIDVNKVFFDTSTSLRARYDYFPRNQMILFLDFGRPEVFNFSILPSQETQNESNIEVIGRDATWVNGVFKEFISFVEERPSTVPWLHRHSIYDIMLFLFGFPLSFWICKKLSINIEGVFGSYSIFLKSALYLYVFVIALNILRIAFHYARWIWPLTEYKSEKSKALKHKAVFSLLAGGLGLPLIYDIIKWLIK